MPQASVLVVTADLDIAYEGHQQPVAHVMAKSGAPFAGLFAFGRHFAAARNALASAVWEQSQMVPRPASPRRGERRARHRLTRKTFPATEL